MALVSYGSSSSSESGSEDEAKPLGGCFFNNDLNTSGTYTMHYIITHTYIISVTRF